MTTSLMTRAKILPFCLNPTRFPENTQKVTDLEIMQFLAQRRIFFMRIPYDATTTSYVFSRRNAGAIEAVIIRSNGKSSICFTDRQEEVELNSVDELNNYNPFILQLTTLCIS